MSAKRLKSSAKWLLLSLMTLSGGCATSGAVISCPAWVKPIFVSKQDVLTDGTAKAILQHNETWQAVCGE